jgi:rRNA maturation endonuclease Nob1
MTGMLWGYRGPDHAGEAEAAARRGARRAADAQEGVRELAARLDKLALVCMALWDLLKEHTDLTEEDLMQRVKQIDLADGAGDGKVTKAVLRCRSCGRVMSTRHTRCMFCGAERLDKQAFDGAL